MRLQKLLLCILALALVMPSVMAAPKLSGPRVTPAVGETDTTFTFTVHFVGEEEPASMQVFLGDVGHDMLQVDPTDRNATDGKDYYFECHLSEGTTIYYYKATMDPDTVVRTTALTVNVKVPDGLRIDHLDVVISVLIFLLPIALFLVFFRRLSRDLRDILEELRKDR